MRSPLLDRPGAVGDHVADHYGNPLVEQRELDAGRAVVDFSLAEVVSLTGSERLTWLDALCSQSLRGLLPGVTREALILSPEGRVEHRFFLVDDGETAWLLTDPGASTALLAWLEKMRFRADVTIALRTDDVTVLAWFGDALTDTIRDTVAPLAVLTDPWPGVSEGGWSYGDLDSQTAENPLHWALIRRDSLGAAASLPLAGSLALNALEVARGRPSLAEVDEKTLPHEWDWLRTAVHLDKGCYRGQETVAKVHNLGHPPRRAVLLHLDGSLGELPPDGAVVSHDDAPVGRVTRVVRHYELGPLALGIVKRTVPPEAVLSVQWDGGEVSAAQEVIVPPEAGATRVPEFRRRPAR